MIFLAITIILGGSPVTYLHAMPSILACQDALASVVASMPDGLQFEINCEATL